jgi:glucose-1-phosphate cytidylyltransferase
MKVVILAGGVGTRISEETTVRPKPMVEIGGKPILWHIMKIFSSFGHQEFVICLGYKGYVIKEYFANYFLHMSDVTFDLSDNTTRIHENSAEPWQVTLVDTGENAMTGGRLRRVRRYLGSEEFFMTYGDGLGNVDLDALLQFHQRQKTIATVTAVQPPGRFGSLVLDRERVAHFQEKPEGNGGWINAGFFVLSPQAIDLVRDDATSWEKQPMEELAAQGKLAAFKHHGFWQPMDTLRDKLHLEELWSSGAAPWQRW